MLSSQLCLTAGWAKYPKVPTVPWWSKDFLKSGEHEKLIWGGYGRPNSTIPWYERKLYWSGFDAIYDWHIDPKVPDHVAKLPFWQKWRHPDWPGFKYYNSSTGKGRVCVSVAMVSLGVYGLFRAISNGKKKNALALEKRRADRAIQRRIREETGDAWWLKK